MSIYGVDIVDPETLGGHHPFADLAETPAEWRRIFETSLESIRKFLAIHDSFEVLAKCTNQALAGAAKRAQNPHWFLDDYAPYETIETPELEILQALALMQTSPRKKVPASPGSMHRLLTDLAKCTHAFVRMQGADNPTDPEREHLISKLRMHTMRYRNHFTKQDCEVVVAAILRQIDELTTRELGFAASEMFQALIGIRRKVEERLNTYLAAVRQGLQASSIAEAKESIEFFCAVSPSARRAWAVCEKRCNTLENFQMAAFQLSEIAHAWPYLLAKAELRGEFGDVTVAFFESISIAPGEIETVNPEHLFLNNPVWRRPFIAIDKSTLFLPLPNLFYGFPFQIFEQLIKGQTLIERAYSAARARFLETMIETHISTAMPSAKVYRKVMWRDEATGALYENDVVALIGNTIFLFEAKSGRLDDVARRGGELSLMRNFKELFVEPAKQAQRLEAYLNSKGREALLWLKDTGISINLNLDRPKVVHKFSICIEHFAALTSAKYNLTLFGAISDDDAWAPVLSLGELILIWTYLDTEVSFFHYLTRRATLEEMIDFEGDEQDILSMYLINGLCIDASQIEGRRLRFLNIDGVVRKGKTPRRDRSEFEVFGIPLSGYWLATLDELYRSEGFPHRFDVLEIVLNQDPGALLGIERQVTKWRRGLASTKKGDLLFARRDVGNRTFVLAYHLAKHAISADEWKVRSHDIAGRAAVTMFGATDCAVLLRTKKSNATTYDGISFHRLKRSS